MMKEMIRKVMEWCKLWNGKFYGYERGISHAEQGH